MGAWRSLLYEFTAMASPCSILIETTNERAANRAARAAMDEVKRIEMKYSRYRGSSVISQINAAAGLKAVAIDAETADLLGFADKLYQTSDGLFDITSGILRQIWNFKDLKIPSAQEVTQTLSFIDWRQVQHNSKSCYLPRKGMQLDFGGFGKEYAADRAAHVLLQHDIAHALVNLGGDIHTLGAHGMPELANQAWKIQVQHPRNAQALLAGVDVFSGGLATSGDYERYAEIDGKRYCHVLHPGTGWSVDYWQSITVVAPNATLAGAMTTIALLKEDSALEWLHTQQAVYIAVDQQGIVYENLSTLT